MYMCLLKDTKGMDRENIIYWCFIQIHQDHFEYECLNLSVKGQTGRIGENHQIKLFIVL